MNGEVARLAADGLGLAAAPVFAAMAALTASGRGGDVLCMASPASPLSGMAAMYLLMAGVHLSPWLRLAAGQGARGR